MRRTVEGRTFTEADNRPGVRDIVIDRVLAGRLFPPRSAIGQTVLALVATPGPERFKVIVVVEP